MTAFLGTLGLTYAAAATVISVAAVVAGAASPHVGTRPTMTYR